MGNTSSMLDVEEVNPNGIKDARVKVAYADGTKTHSQEKGKSKNDVYVVSPQYNP